jgi:hypothetical protein
MVTRTCVIFKYYFTSKSSAANHESFSNAYTDKDVPDKTIHGLLTFWNTRSVCLLHEPIKRQNSCYYGLNDFKQSTRCNKRIRLQEFNTVIGFVALCVKGFMCTIYIGLRFKWKTLYLKTGNWIADRELCKYCGKCMLLNIVKFAFLYYTVGPKRKYDLG